MARTIAERDADIKRCQCAARKEPGEDAAEASELAFKRFERTRRALIWIERGMPYWRFSELRLAEMVAAGIVTERARQAYDEGVRG
jgi:hypothetical protein